MKTKKSKVLSTLIVAVLAMALMFTLTACGGLGGLFNSDKDNDNDGDKPAVVSTFATDSWAKIALVSASGNAKDTYYVGDEKEVRLSTGEWVAFVILGFDHDTLANGNSKAGITIGMKNLLSATHRMVETSENGDWSSSALRNDTMATIFGRLPTDLQGAIKEVEKLTPLGATASSGVLVTTDKLFVFSARELNNSTNTAGGTPYEYWTSVKDGSLNADKVKYLGGFGAAAEWHIRVAYTSSNSSWINNTGGAVSGNSISTARGVCFGFSI